MSQNVIVHRFLHEVNSSVNTGIGFCLVVEDKYVGVLVFHRNKNMG
jgi:hypothetical protein